jgi:cystathionine beta-lyase family protein involved in aluminum resistance
MPVNARFTPVPGAVPGYADPVLMSSGAFIGGATIELSCDAPLRPPYEVYVQGGVLASHAYLGALFAARALESPS